jgi:phosphatidylglycerophosphate synthase
VVGLVLVGLVREGLPVAASNARLFGFARPLANDEAGIALAALEDANEDRLALASAVKASDGFFTTFFVSPYSRYIARWAARRGFTPNQVTAVSFLLGVVAAVVFAAGSRAALVAGAVLLQVSFTVDCVDGQLARYTRTFSQLGAWLDSVFDRSKEFLVFAGLAYGSAHARGDDVWTLAAAALTLQTVRHMVGFAYSVQPGLVAPMRFPPLEEVDATTDGDDGGPAAPPRSGAPTTSPTAAPSRRGARGSALRGLGRRAVTIANALDKHAWARWVRRIIVLPIGERFALISLVAALATPRATFVALLAWGGFAALYTGLGRILRSMAR